MRKFELKELLKEIGVIPQKLLGQNFLASDEIAGRIVDAAALSKDDFVVEVGPGLGVVTGKILDSGATLLAVEIDKKLSGYLKKRFSSCKNFQLLVQDFLLLKQRMLFSHNGSKPPKLISNPPYRGAKKIIKRITVMNVFSTVVITLQKEVADTLLTEAGDRNATALTYYIRYRFKARKLFTIPNNFFYPTPTISSSTILLEKRKQPKKHINEIFLFRTIDHLFRSKRKMLKNNIKSAFNIPPRCIETILQKSGLQPQARPTDLTIEQMVDISELILKETQKKP
ncbi:MAG: ribosomal RNA small subunit methyltransferase A [Candidatus Cloacimonadota bacterium]|nr:MAG: ribosomal RNA small subunit methyltransferase A [Candidatus Cloacimonadota bacterium]